MLKRLTAVTTTLLVAAGLSVVGFAAPASATHPTVSGVAVCNTETGLFDITWTVGGDPNPQYDEIEAEISTATLSSGDLDPDIVGAKVKGASVVVTTSQNGMPAGTYTLDVDVQFTSHAFGQLVNKKGSVTAEGECVGITPNPVAPSVQTAAECEVLDSIVVPADTAKLDYTQTPSPAAVGLNTVTVAPISPWILPDTVVAGWVQTTPNALWTWTTTLAEPELCDLPDLADITVNASATSGVCTPSTGTISGGFITTAIPAEFTASEVSFYRGGAPDPQTLGTPMVLGSNPLPPGTYLVTAFANNEDDGVVPSIPSDGGVQNEDGSVSWTLTIAAAPANPLCEDLETMALTGYERAPEISGGAAALLMIGIVAMFFGYRRFA